MSESLSLLQLRFPCSLPRAHSVSAVSVTTEAWQTFANATVAARQLTSSVPACPVDYHPVLIAKPTYGLTGSAFTVVYN